MCPKDEFTLTKLKELNLDETPQSLEAVTKVCDVAGKEYAIEQVARPPHTCHRTPLPPHLRSSRSRDPHTWHRTPLIPPLAPHLSLPTSAPHLPPPHPAPT